jgi:hydroxyacylglutathione hydrolase
MKIIPIKLRISYAYLVIGQRPLLVDSGSPGELPKIERRLRAAGVDPRELALVIHTHAHYDHCGSTLALQEAYGVPAAIHAEDLPKFQAGENGPLTSPGTRMNWATRLAAAISQRYAAPRPDLVLQGDMDLAPYGVEGCVIHTPGHTPGSLTVLIAGAGAIAGDLLMGGSLFGMLNPSRPAFHSIILDRGQVLASIRRVAAADVPRVYLGHGGPLEMGALRAWVEEVNH